MALDYNIPNTRLMAELREVKNAAEEFEDSLKKTNRLPDGFEREALSKVLRALKALPEGTALVAQTNLRVGKAEVQEIEELYFKTEDAVLEPDEHQGDNYLERRSMLGRSILILKATIDTALSECRRQGQTSETEDAPPEDERRVESTPDIDLDERLYSIEQKMHISRTELDEIFKENAPNREPIKRILQDTETLSLMVRGVNGLKSTSKWVWTGLGNTLKAAPKVLIKAMQLVKTTNEVARPLTKRWNDFQTDLTNFVHDQIDKTADAVIKSAQIITDISTPPPIPHVDPNIQEAAEAKATMLLKQNKPVPDDIALNVRKLDLRDADFSKAELLGNIKSLQTIDLDGTKIANFTPLRRLTNLVSLDLSNTQVADLTPISPLDKLQTLYLSDTQVADWAPVAHIKNVRGRPDDWDK